MISFAFKAHLEKIGLLKLQFIHDVVYDIRSSCCGKSQYGGLGFHLSDISDAEIRWTEIIAPLADAMGFVDGDEANVDVA